MREEQGRGLILTLVDIVGFFDKENILDVMDTMDTMGVDRRAARLWFKLNQKTEIRVKTAVGMTGTAEVGALVGQGSSGAAVVSQAMVDTGLKEYFAGSSDEMYYGTVRVESAAFQDDVSKPSSDVFGAQAGMTRLAAMLGARGLEAHPEKTGYLVYGSKEYRKEVEKELEAAGPLRFGEFEARRKESDKYLGQVMHEGGLRRSVEATILERVGRIKGGIYTTASILDTVEMRAMGGLMAAKHLWEGAIVPSLLSGAGTWVGITAKEEEMCEELQELFWRTILQVPRGTPRVMLTAETACRKMKLRIWKEKLRLARRIKRQDGSLAKAIFDEQVVMGWPGLAKEVEVICKEVGLENVYEKEVGREELEEAIFYANQKMMKEEMLKYEKLKSVKDGDFRKEQEYMEEKGVERARTAFRIRTRMLKKVKMNYKNNHRDNLKCENCDWMEDESQEHIMICPAWKEEVGSLDVTVMNDQVEFFTRVMRRKVK